MYKWRTMTPAQREQTLRQRKLNERPTHSPKHTKTGSGVYLITATCYEHKPVIGFSDERLDQFSAELLQLLALQSKQVDAWVVLPNHYHAVVRTTCCADLLHSLGRFHGRTSFQWNGEESKRGRKVWFNFLERLITTDDHHITAIQYVHHNPVKHGHVKKWSEWKWSSAREYIEATGRKETERQWRDYPLGDFGDGWDD